MQGSSLPARDVQTEISEKKEEIPLYHLTNVATLPKLTIDEASKERFERGLGADDLEDSQGYIGFVDLTDGKIFHTITYGVNLMGSHASQVNPEERWKIVMYVHQLAHGGPAPAASDSTSAAPKDSTVALNK